MNTDDNEKRLAQLAMAGVGLPQTRNGAIRFTKDIYGLVNAPVKPVKGFCASTNKADRAKAKRARKLAKRH